MRFERAAAEKDINGDRCDNCFLCKNPCDAYIVVKIDGVEHYRSSTVHDTYSPNFDSTTFISGIIRDDARITMEMWDNDDGDTDDDLMARWETLSINRLRNQIHWSNKYNSVEVYSKWLSS